jgi:hypothetical protein
MWGKKLLVNTMLKAKLIERGIPELGPIIPANRFQAVGMLIVQPSKPSSESAQTLHLCSPRRKLKSNKNSCQ